MAVNGYYPGQRIQQYVRDQMIAETSRLGVDIVPLTRPYGADSDTVYLQHVLTDEPVLVDATSLVLSQGHLPVLDLVTALDSTSYDVHLIGDCLSPRTVEEAVLDGLRVASSI